MLEAAAVVGIYVVYSWAGDAVIGAAPDAFRNAEQIIDWEERLGLYHERTVQEWFLPYRWFTGFWNLFYGSIHFGALVLALIALYHFDPGRYVLWRNVFLWMLPLALIGFWLYPLMPPRPGTSSRRCPVSTSRGRRWWSSRCGHSCGRGGPGSYSRRTPR